MVVVRLTRLLGSCYRLESSCSGVIRDKSGNNRRRWCITMIPPATASPMAETTPSQQGLSSPQQEVPQATQATHTLPLSGGVQSIAEAPIGPMTVKSARTRVENALLSASRCALCARCSCCKPRPQVRMLVAHARATCCGTRDCPAASALGLLGKACTRLLDRLQI